MKNEEFFVLLDNIGMGLLGGLTPPRQRDLIVDFG
jgi:hypothetical protein